MPSRSEVTYFGPGPAALPTPVLEAAAEALLNYQSTGVGLAEHSHRSPFANKILSDTKNYLKELLEVPDDYEILFMQGGGSAEFSAVVYHMVSVWVERHARPLKHDIISRHAISSPERVHQELVVEMRKLVREELKLDYLVTGSWSLKASQEAARLVGEEYVHIALDARDATEGEFIDIPGEDTWELTPTRKEGGTGAAMVYYCDNETVDGVEFPGFPRCLESQDEDGERLVVADMSSNILSRRVNVKKFAIIFAAAQKNVGSTGLTLVIIRKSLLPPQTATSSPRILRDLGLPVAPIILDFATMAKNNSLYNTLPIFDVWIAGQVMHSLLTGFGDRKLAGQEEMASAKAELLYSVLDKYPGVYTVVPNKNVRSRMNLCFRVAGGEEEVEKKWLKGAEERGLLGLKGHRSVGGIRISNYNPIPMEGAQKLAQYIEDFAKKSVE
ncbi:MAG: translation termination inhibitor protein itt1 [Watsoniomyces obsoletus]|nr:MAG: translation termination inhibitor protein itt1 [Watsoniomyces obsoletus]